MIEELVDLLDEAGRVVGIATRSEMRQRNLRHRSVGVVVRSTGGSALLAHRRAPWKDVWPSQWDLAFGGVCTSGEPSIAAALRELQEEAGVNLDERDLWPLGTASYDDERVRVLADLYLVDFDGPFEFVDGEVAQTEWVALDGLDDWAATHPLCADTAATVLPLVREL